MQSMTLCPKSVKKLMAIMWKFLWNKNFLAARAPERIKRIIVNTPLWYGGLGMIDIEELDASLKLKALGRLVETLHPFLTLLKRQLKLDSFFLPRIESKVETVANKL